jgi:hypothetical protein
MRSRSWNRARNRRQAGTGLSAGVRGRGSVRSTLRRSRPRLEGNHTVACRSIGASSYGGVKSSQEAGIPCNSIPRPNPVFFSRRTRRGIEGEEGNEAKTLRSERLGRGRILHVGLSDGPLHDSTIGRRRTRRRTCRLLPLGTRGGEGRQNERGMPFWTCAMAQPADVPGWISLGDNPRDLFAANDCDRVQHGSDQPLACARRGDRPAGPVSAPQRQNRGPP